MKVVGYVRVSTEDQAETGEGLPVQIERIEKYAKDRGWELLLIYKDAGISGAKSENRPDLLRMLQDAKNKEFEAVIVTDISRFGRDSRESNNNIFEILQAGVDFISIKENIRRSLKITDPSEIFKSDIHAAVAQYEKSQIKDRMSAGKMRKWSDHRCIVGHVPYGYEWDRVTKKIEINEKEKERYLEIVDMYLIQGLSMKDLALRLEEDGKISKKKPFNSSTISYILKNPAYYGDWVVNKHVYDGKRRTGEMKPSDKHVPFKLPGEPFISKSKWDQIQERTGFMKSKGKRITLTSDNWLRDMVFCGKCGGRVKPKIGNKRKDGSQLIYYRCYWSGTSAKDLAASNKKKCSLPYILAEKLEDRIWNRIVFHLTVRRDKYFDALVADKRYETLVVGKTKRSKEIKDEIAKQNRVKENLGKLLEKEVFNADEYASKLDTVNKKITKLEYDYKACEDEMAEAKELLTKIKMVEKVPRANQTKLSNELDKLHVDDRKRLAENMFGKILVYRDKTDEEGFKIEYHHYGPVTILDALIKEGKLPSFNLNSPYHTSRPHFS